MCECGYACACGDRENEGVSACVYESGVGMRVGEREREGVSVCARVCEWCEYVYVRETERGLGYTYVCNKCDCAIFMP